MEKETLLTNKYIIYAAFSLLIAASLFFAAKIITEIKSYRYIGGGVLASNAISVSGEGEVFAVPDIATIIFSAASQGKTVAMAQKEASKKIDAALAFLKNSGISDKDIKTTNYSAHPRYEYNEVVCLSLNCPRPGKQTLVGYDVMQTISVKARDTDKVGAILEGLAKAGITEISGPNFSIDDEEKLKAEARKYAIADAKEKAAALAGDLGVSLVRIISFSEAGNYPIYYAKALESAGGNGGDVLAPEIPKGENKISSNVTITYEIR
ncbi:MAG: SIMPL domain-containing protein [Patescibacteria group bacterium]